MRTLLYLFCTLLFCFISICKLGRFRNHFLTITGLSELYFRFRKFSWKPCRWVRINLLLRMRDMLYTSISTWNHSLNSVAAAEASNLKISILLLYLSNDLRDDHPNKRENSFEFEEKSMETETTNMIRISQQKKSHCKTYNSIKR